MKLTLPHDESPDYVAQQPDNIFPHETVPGDQLRQNVYVTLKRAAHYFAHIRNKYFNQAGEVYFNHLHTDQYAMFLYFLSNSLYRESNDPDLASKVYGLNKALHAIDVFYEVELPDIFFFQHPLGTVLGRAQYSDYLIVYSRCSVAGILNVEEDVATVNMGSSYDIVGWLQSEEGTPLEHYKSAKPVNYQFYFTKEQLEARADQFKRYDTEINALSKIVTRASNVETLFSKVGTSEGEQIIYADTDRDRFTRYSLAG